MVMNKVFIFLLVFLFANASQAKTSVDSLIQVSENDTTSYENKLDAYKHLINYHLKKSLDTSLIYSEKYYDLANQNKDDIGICMSLFYKAKSYSKNNEQELAEKYYQEATDLAIKINDSNLITYTMLNLGVVKGKLDKATEAIDILTRCKQLSYESNNKEYVIKSVNSLGIIYLDKSDYSKALVTFIEGVNESEKHDDTYLKAVLPIGVGNTYLVLSDYENAITYYFKALDIAEKENYIMIQMVALTNISSAYIALKKYDKAKIIVLKSIDFFTENNYQEYIANSYDLMGKIYTQTKQFDSALVYYQKSLEIYREKNGQGIVYCLYSLGDLLITTKDYEQAEKYLLEAKQIAETHSYYYNLSHTYNTLGRLYLITNEQKGLYYYNKSLQLAQEHNIVDSKLPVYKALYTINKENGDYKISLENYEAYVALNDSIKGEDSKLKVEEIETRYEVDKKDQEITLLQKEQEIAEIKHQQEQEKSKQQKILILLVSGILILIVGIILLRLKARQKSKIQKLETRSLKVETQMLRSQMNPHFIFNSLNSIQSFISEKDTLDAERYMSKFAKLMRLILDNSRKSFILMENEITTLNHYLELEQLRFDKRFTFQITTANIDKEFTKIPPMLVQPYVENAILHGVGGITSGVISIDYKQVGTKVICTIDDNGVGRKKSAELKNHKKPTRESLGIKVTEERIALLESDFKTTFSIQIIDKTDSDLKALGTTVIIEMPFIEK